MAGIYRVYDPARGRHVYVNQFGDPVNLNQGQPDMITKQATFHETHTMNMRAIWLISLLATLGVIIDIYVLFPASEGLAIGAGCILVLGGGLSLTA